MKLRAVATTCCPELADILPSSGVRLMDRWRSFIQLFCNCTLSDRVGTTRHCKTVCRPSKRAYLSRAQAHETVPKGNDEEKRSEQAHTHTNRTCGQGARWAAASLMAEAAAARLPARE